MNVGIYFDLRNPPSWASDPTRLYGFTLEMCEEAEALGCHSVWLSEHHLFDDGYLPQPLMVAAAIASRTKRVRIGTAILIAPLHHPVEIAEQVAVADVISGGRIDLGLGAGYRVPEFELFDADLDHRYTATDRAAREVRRLWCVVTPRPVQANVPIWMGFQGPKGARRAGLLGEGLLSLDKRLWEPYRDGLVEGGYDPATTARMAGSLNGWVSEDPDRDWPIVSTHFAAQLDSYRRHMVEGTDQPIPRPVDPQKMLHREDARNPLNTIVFGSPEHLAERIRALSDGTPTETVYLWASIAGMPEDVVARNINTICTKLAPLLAEARRQ